MNFKIDTREKFTVITPLSDFLYDNLTAEFLKLSHSFIEKRINLVINFKNVNTINEHLIEQIAALQEEFYQKNLSFVLCDIRKNVLNVITELELDEILNIAPSETEAWDIVQMEEVERELLGDE